MSPPSLATPHHDSDTLVMRQVADALVRFRAAMLDAAVRAATAIERVHPAHRTSATNLAHYLGLRHQDLRHLHKPLAMLGLSSLGRTEAATLASVDAVLRMLARASGSPVPEPAPSPGPDSLDAGRHLLDEHAARALGHRPERRAVRIMVTMPTEAATDPALIPSLVRAGMNVMRINCAHDGPAHWRAMIDRLRAAERDLGARCLVAADLGGPKVRIEALARSGGEALRRVRVRIGDTMLLQRGHPPDRFIDVGGEKSLKRPARVWCSIPRALDAVEVGHRVWFDDGAVATIAREITADRIALEVVHAPAEGVRLRAEKGINLPDTPTDLPALCEEDYDHLDALVEHVDAIGLSFAHTPGDVLLLQHAIEARTQRRPAIVLKIETRAAFERLPEMLFALLRWEACALMIARGDLAVECGYERLSEVQEEIMWLAEAAHVPVIWATQVLESLAHTGAPTRAEITDAAMGQRAECVMLNKGPYIVETIALLDDILRRMASHQRKKTPLLRPLKIAAGAPDVVDARSNGGGVDS